MIEAWTSIFSFLLASSILPARRAAGKAKSASPVCSMAARVPFSGTGFHVMVSTFGKPVCQ